MMKNRIKYWAGIAWLFALTASCTGPGIVGGGKNSAEPIQVTQLRKRMPAIMKSLERIRGLPLKSNVQVKYQTPEQFRAAVLKSISEDLTPQRMAATSRMYQSLGLLPKGLDLTQSLLDLTGGQAVAHFSPEKDTIFLLDAGETDAELDATALHELQHAVQDQHFKIDTLMAAVKDNDDSSTALRFLIEGEAHLVMMIYGLKGESGASGVQLESEILRMSSLDRETSLFNQRIALEIQSEAPAQREEINRLARAPLYLYRTLLDPYYKGAYMVLTVKKSGGWDSVSKLFRNPPTSTEQVLHPEKLIGERDEPILIDLPDLSKSFGSAWTRKEQNTVGELGLQVLFKERTGQKKLSACAGWGGDRLQSYEQAEGKNTALVWYSVWDSPEDAGEFAYAYGDILSRELGQELESDAGIDMKLFRKGEEELCLFLKGRSVLIIEGSPKGRCAKIMASALNGVKLGPNAMVGDPLKGNK
jgi:hypothetical protein